MQQRHRTLVANVALCEEFDSLLGTNKEAIARRFGVMGVNVFARK